MSDGILNPNGTPVPGDESITIFEVFQQLMGAHPLPSPIKGAEQTAMIIGTCGGGRGVIGSVHEFPEFLNDVWVHYPLAFGEIIQRDPRGQPLGVAFTAGRVFNTLSMPRLSRVSLDYFTILKADSSKDKEALRIYEDAMKAYMVDDAGLIMAPPGALSGLKDAGRS